MLYLLFVFRFFLPILFRRERAAGDSEIRSGGVSDALVLLPRRCCAPPPHFKPSHHQSELLRNTTAWHGGRSEGKGALAGSSAARGRRSGARAAGELHVEECARHRHPPHSRRQPAHSLVLWSVLRVRQHAYAAGPGQNCEGPLHGYAGRGSAARLPGRRADADQLPRERMQWRHRRAGVGVGA